MRRTKQTPRAWIAAGLLLTGVCSCDPTAPTQAPSPRSYALTTLPCEDAIGSTATPDPGMSTVFDRVALPTGRALQAEPTRDADPAAKLFAKSGLLIKRGVSFDLIVLNEWAGRLTIRWGSPGNRSAHVRVPRCRPTEKINPLCDSDPWVAYAGGYWVSQPACVLLTVKTDQAEQTVQIGVGAVCPGQAPRLAQRHNTIQLPDRQAAMMPTGSGAPTQCRCGHFDGRGFGPELQ